MANVINYFSHDSNARNSDKIIKLRMKLGMEGYGIYFALLERLRDEKEYKSLRDYEILAFDFRVDVEKIRSVVEDFDLFEISEDGNSFYSKGFLERMEIKDSIKKKRSDAGKKGAEKKWNKIDGDIAGVETDEIEACNSYVIKDNSNVNTKDSNTIAKDSKSMAKNGKEKESKEKKSKEIYSQNSNEFRLAYLLFKLLKMNNDKFKMPNLQEWAKHIDLMLRIDKRSVDDVEKVIRFCQQDEFWWNNIRSTSKLRQQFDALYPKAAKLKPKGICQSDNVGGEYGWDRY
ncbi:Lin1244/Lin1753 domain-containing protein [Peptostreptococcus canis]|uniref:DUF4373 domain-containing protein n=1 Tax=Peptostreptococcus canis TaxID=1159213 RepID=A0ABR6TJ36_9FIRM|nr:Lin1244/Lin1753 domain-containing protein [Peptostreptococcus canis]MBC2575199.1 DUF4373 domain-containing protein [Peptostreptococcus canis]MBP1997624.1 hypothetical protein [Peptostreptococcus canis]